MTLESSLGFGSLALFCPPGQPFISLEPRSAVSDALTLMHNPSVFATGICPLRPGETWTAWARLSAAPVSGRVRYLVEEQVGGEERQILEGLRQSSVATVVHWLNGRGYRNAFLSGLHLRPPRSADGGAGAHDAPRPLPS